MRKSRAYSRIDNTAVSLVRLLKAFQGSDYNSPGQAPGPPMPRQPYQQTEVSGGTLNQGYGEGYLANKTAPKPPEPEPAVSQETPVPQLIPSEGTVLPPPQNALTTQVVGALFRRAASTTPDNPNDGSSSVLENEENELRDHLGNPDQQHDGHDRKVMLHEEYSDDLPDSDNYTFPSVRDHIHNPGHIH